MDYFNKVRDTVSKAVEQVGNVVAGNPALRLFEPGDIVGTAGPAHFWKIFKGKKRSTGQPVAVWVFERKQIDSYSKDDQTKIIELLKKGVNQLTRVRHPRVLVVEHPLEEGRESFIFCTEPVIGSLANVLGQTDVLPVQAANQHKQYNLHEIEIRIGLKQVAEALCFLHVDAKMIHRNVCPTSIILNEKGDFKLAGFDFAQIASSSDNSAISCDCSDVADRGMWQLMPSIDYLAPELSAKQRAEPASDVYSLALCAYAIFNEGKAPLQCKHRLDVHRQNADKFKTVPAEWCLRVSQSFREDFKLCLNKEPQIRPNAAQFTKISFFEDHRLTTVQTLESFMQLDQMVKIELLKKLPDLLIHFEKRLLVQKIRPSLTAEFSRPELIPFILPSLFYIINLSDKDEFSKLFMPDLIPVFAMDRPYQITILLLEKLDLFLSRAEQKDVDNYILPCLYRAIKNENGRIQEICLSVVPKIAKLISRHNMKTDVLPRLLALAGSGDTLAVRVQSLVCIGNLMPNLEEWMVTEQIFPAIPKINAKEPAVLMAILGIYQRIFSGFSINAQVWARSALPFLIFSSVDMSLNKEQYLQYTGFIETVHAKVKDEQLKKLATLSSAQEASRTGPNSASILAPASNTETSSDLDNIFNNGATAKSKPPVSVPGVMSLEEKRQLAAAQEGSSTSTATSSAKVPMNQMSASKVSMSQMKTSAPVMPDWFSPPAPAKSVSPVPSNGQITLSDFDTLFMKSAPSQPPPSTTNSGFLPQPPRSQNLAIQRSGNSSSLNELLNIGTTNSQPSLNSLSASNPLSNFGLPPPPPLSSSHSIPMKPTSSDPFADLLS